MKFVKFIQFILIFIFIACSSNENLNQNFEFSGVYKFWEITEILEKNNVPSENQWNFLFRTPGYKVLIENEFEKEFFIKNFKLVYIPSKMDSLNEKLRKGIDKKYLQHYMKAKESKAELKEQIKVLKNNPYSKDAIRLAMEYLPFADIKGAPLVSFVIFANDGRDYHPIVIDLLATINWDFLPFLAHEFHHFYRDKYKIIDMSKIEPADYYFVWAIDQIQKEGLADQIDKKKWFHKNYDQSNFQIKKFKRYVNQSPELIKKMDNILTEAFIFSERREELSKKLREILPQSGHHPGYYMADAIIDRIGKEKLVESFANPFEFFRLYQKASELNEEDPSFSEKSIEFIRSLEKKYLEE